MVIRQGDLDDSAYALIEGSLTVFAATPFGEVHLATLTAPAIVGEIAALAGVSRTAGVKALSAVRLLRLTGAALLEAGQANPELFVRVIRKLGSEIETVNRALGLYTNALTALEQQALSADILAELAHPPAQMAGFASVFERFAREITAKKKQQEELASAALIQQSFLPKGKLATAGLDLHAAMLAAKQVGGDFYDYRDLGQGRLLVVIGDVCGKGMPASLFMAVAITTLRAVAEQESGVAALAAAANRLLCANNSSSLFATAVIGILDTASGLFRYCNCGHCPVIHRSAAGTMNMLGATGLPLGLFPNKVAAEKSVTLAAGDLLLLYSDGITESVNPALEEYGEERLARLTAARGHLAVHELVDLVVGEAVRFADGAEQADDITCLALRLPSPST